jgi:uncharacterized protein (TIGR03437 family)
MRFPLVFLLLAVRCIALPISFEQRDARHFISRCATGIVEVLPDRVVTGGVTLRFAGTTGAQRLEGNGPAAPSTYLRAGFSRTLRQFPRLAMHRLYPGIDAVFYGHGEDLEYDLQLAAGASPERIRIAIEGARGVRIDDSGDLLIETASGTLAQKRPRVMQGNREVPVRYVLRSRNEVGIRLGRYDRHAALTIDPVLSFRSTFGGSQSNTALLTKLDAQGNIFVAGLSNSPDFPTTAGGFEPKPVLPVEVVSNGGNSVTPLRVGSAFNVNLVGGSTDGKVLYAATPGGILLSGDSGATWRPTAPLPVATMAPNPTPSVTVYAISVDPLDPATLLVGTSAGLFGSNSAGQFWGERNSGLAVSRSGYVRVTSVFYHPANPLIAYATTADPGYLYASSDAGNTWLPLNPTYPGEPAPQTDPFNPVAAALSADGGTLYAINANGNLLKSADGGKTWTRLAQGLTNPVRIQFDPNNASTIYVLTQYLGFYKSVDGGVTFTRVITPFGVQQFAFDDAGVLYIAYFTALDVSMDGGATFNAVPHLVNYSINALSSLGGKVYVASIAPPVPFVVKLNPSGTTILASTFLGGSAGDYPTGLAVDAQGQPVLVGYTASADFPFTTPINPAASTQREAGFVAKLSADGSRLIFATGLGGSKGETIQAVAIDASGAVYVTGVTASPDFPTTAGAFQMALPSSTCPRPATNFFLPNPNSGQYAFVSKLTPDGSSLAYSTFLTGSCGSFGRGIAVNSAGEAYTVGGTTSPDFPVQTGGYQAAFPGGLNIPSPGGILQAGFAVKLSAAGDKLLAGTYLGGGYSTIGTAVTLDAAGNAYLTGSTQGFATKATPGAFQQTFVDHCNPRINIGPGPPYTGTSDAFILKLDPALSIAGLFTYFGGSCDDSGVSLGLDGGGNIWVSGFTSSPDLPLKDPYQAGGIYSPTAPGFLAELSADGAQLLFSSYTEGSAMALNSAGVFVAGTSGNMVSVVKIDPATTPAVHIDNIAPVVSFPTGFVQPVIPGVTPGLLVQITGRNLGPATKVNAQLDAFNRLPDTVANTSVLFDGIPAPLISVQASSIICFVPFEVGSTTQVTVLLANGQKSNSVRAGVTATSPQILTVVNQDGSLNSASNPAKFGSVIVLYVTGLGQTTPPSVDGLVNSTPLPVPNVPVSVYLTGNPSSSVPQAVMSAAGMVAGITQVNVALPASLPPGLSAGAKAITVSIVAAQAPVYVTQ